MSRPEAGSEGQALLGPLTQAALFLVLTVSPGEGDQIRDALADVDGLRHAVGFRAPEDGLSCVAGIGSDLWDRMFGDPKPVGLHRLPVFAGARHQSVTTPGDLLLHIRARRFDLCFELATRLVRRLQPAATVVDEVHGFRSFDMRDLLGFVDGTENPEGAAAAAAAITQTEDPRFAGGSYVIVQKYAHDLDGWNAISVEEQERVIGRTKLGDIELGDDVKPANSHVALNTILGDDGKERQIVRFNMPFGHVADGEFGTYYIAYARQPDVIEQMLTNMFVGNPPGNYDRILDFSTALTGSLFFIPTAAFLEDPPDLSRDPDQTENSTAESADGSLGIGSLRETPR